MPTPTKAALLFLVALASPAYAAPVVTCERSLSVPGLDAQITASGGTFTYGDVTGPLTPADFVVGRTEATLSVGGLTATCSLLRNTLIEQRGTVANRDPDGRDSTTWRTRTWRALCTLNGADTAGIVSTTRTVRTSHRKETLP